MSPHASTRAEPQGYSLTEGVYCCARKDPYISKRIKLRHA